jgi:hypothetical protein
MPTFLGSPQPNEIFSWQRANKLARGELNDLIGLSWLNQFPYGGKPCGLETIVRKNLLNI